MQKTVDTRGLVSPDPVMMIRKALDAQEITDVLAIVDDRAALEHVDCLARTMNLTSMVDEHDGTYFVSLSKQEVQPYKQNLKSSTVILVKSNVLGQGDDKLGAMLMQSLLHSFTQMDGEIKSLIFLNSGVLLTTAGSHMLGHIKQLEQGGVEVFSCSTCLEFYGLADKLEVGRVINMCAVAEEMLRAARVIAL